MTTHFLVGRSGVEQEVFGRRVRERAVLHALAERVQFLVNAVNQALRPIWEHGTRPHTVPPGLMHKGLHG